jgi:hypothetical protein
VHHKLYLGASQLKLNDATYEELLNTVKLYSFASGAIACGVNYL